MSLSVCIPICLHVSTFIHKSMCACLCLHVYMHMCMCLCICMHRKLFFIFSTKPALAVPTAYLLKTLKCITGI
uniref:Uncharacterized protein n=1 Tax=Gopherus agassizii TaxID=38772 RepID=A0A452GZ02_9SAUR